MLIINDKTYEALLDFAISVGEMLNCERKEKEDLQEYVSRIDRLLHCDYTRLESTRDIMENYMQSIASELCLDTWREGPRARINLVDLTHRIIGEINTLNESYSECVNDFVEKCEESRMLLQFLGDSYKLFGLQLHAEKIYDDDYRETMIKTLEKAAGTLRGLLAEKWYNECNRRREESKI